jgi:integrase
MPKIAKALTAIEIPRLRHGVNVAGEAKPKLHPVGTVPGLGLLVKPPHGDGSPAARSWVLRTTIGNRRTDIGLGSFPEITLAKAHEAARLTRERIAHGEDPVKHRRARRTATVNTFERCAAQYIELHRASWKNAKHAAQWTATLATYAAPLLGDKTIGAITTADVVEVLRPIWTTKTETATRVRNRIELVLDWATAQGMREGLNPARWRGCLDAVLPRASKVSKREHHAALPYGDVPSFMRTLRTLPTGAARALEFTILTAARSGEVRLAQWSDIDLTRAVWTVPAERMKAGREHRVALSPEAVALLQALPRIEGAALVFPSPQRARKATGEAATFPPLSDMTLTAIMRRLKVDAVPHGFRSSFRDWVAEATAHPPEVAEMALAHVVGDKTEAAYRRGDLFEKRRLLMADWAAFLAQRTAPTAGT